MHMARLHNRTGIILRLQQARHKPRIINTDSRRGLLQTQIRIKPTWQHVTAFTPSTRRISLTSKSQQRLTVLGIK